MGQNPTDTLGKAAGLTRGRSQTQETISGLLERAMDAVTGAIGIPTGIDSKAVTFGELLSAAVPFMGAVKAGARTGSVARQLTNGMYSRLDEAAQMLPKKGVQASGVMNWLKKAPEGISQEEAAYRKLPEWLGSQWNQVVTPEALAAHLKANPAPFPNVKTLGGPQVPKLSPEDIDARFKASNVPEGHDPKNYPGYWEAYDRRTGSLITRGPSEAEVRRQSLVFGPRENDAKPKFEKWQVAGGENYRETLMTLPDTTGARLDARRREIESLGRDATSAQKQEWAEIMNQLKPDNRDIEGISKFAGRPEFRSSHYSDDPNLLVHTRANDRTLPSGEPGRFVEEVQSDWHQQGLKRGYQSQPGRSVQDIDREMDAVVNELRERPGVTYAPSDSDWTRNSDLSQRHDSLAAERRTAVAESRHTDTVPDAPFKDTWPDLGLKQQLIEAANDPKAEWLGFTGGKTQADRYDLSKQIQSIDYRSKPNGWYELGAVDINGDGVQGLTGLYQKHELADVVGKEVADKIVAGEGRSGGGRMTLSGLDLKVGGEGMHAFYDQKLPKRLEKIVKPFGGTVESGEIPSLSEMDSATGERFPRMTQAWFSRLTPEMKDAIKRGVPLMSLFGAAAVQQLQKERK